MGISAKIKRESPLGILTRRSNIQFGKAPLKRTNHV